MDTLGSRVIWLVARPTDDCWITREGVSEDECPAVEPPREEIRDSIL
jgi:hypothetical protein